MWRLPSSAVARAQAYLAGKVEPALPRAAATVVLSRDGLDGIEVYLLRRASSMLFASGMYVFPGGTVDPRDAEADMPWAGPEPAQWAAELSCSQPQAQAIVCAAVRETFEESGVLLAGPTQAEVVAEVAAPEWEAARAALVEHRLSLREFLTRRSLLLRSDLLKAWAHWLTPEFEPRRYDTRFFVAALPTGQRCRDVGGEASEAGWSSARTALAQYEAGALAMLPPTVATLRELSAYERVADAWRAPRRLTRVMPRVVRRDGDLVLVVDGDPGSR